MRMAIIRNGLVIGAVHLEPPGEDQPAGLEFEAEMPLPEGDVALEHAEAGPGWTWSAGSGFAPPTSPAAVVPDAISPRQFRLALLQLDLLDSVETLVADPATPRSMRIEWEYAAEIRRDHPAWTDMLALAGRSAAELDAVFVLGATL